MPSMPGFPLLRWTAFRATFALASLTTSSISSSYMPFLSGSRHMMRLAGSPVRSAGLHPSTFRAGPGKRPQLSRPAVSDLLLASSREPFLKVVLTPSVLRWHPQYRDPSLL